MNLSLAEQKARTLIEALPYIRQFRNRPMVIKVGGSLMDREDLLHTVIQDVLLMRFIGIRPVLVHGGGKHITQLMKRLGMEAVFVDGLRVTDTDTMEVTQMVLSGLINKNIVSNIAREGGRAVGISGRDGGLILAKKMSGGVDLGHVGEIVKIQPDILHTLDKDDFIPVVSPIGSDAAGQSLNINADNVATEIAATLQAEKLIFLTDVNGVLRDIKDPASVISRIRVNEIDRLEKDGIVSKGMIPKVRSAADALARGIHSIHIIGGTTNHSILLELLTEEGIGTQITL